MTFSPLTCLLLFAVGLAAGFVDTIAGGGGLITLPVLLNLGMPVPLALGTNKLQSTFGSVSASFHFVRSGLVTLRDCLPGIVATFVGALAGTFAVQQVKNEALQAVVPWLLAVVVAYTIFQPKLGEHDRAARLGRLPFFLLFGLAIGFYDGFLGPGTGSFWVVSFIAFLGMSFRTATAHTKVVNATSNVASLALFLAMGKVYILPGLVMGVGQLFGAWLGSHVVIAKGARWIRPLFLTMVILTIARLIYVNR